MKLALAVETWIEAQIEEMLRRLLQAAAVVATEAELDAMLAAHRAEE